MRSVVGDIGGIGVVMIEAIDEALGDCIICSFLVERLHYTIFLYEAQA